MEIYLSFHNCILFYMMNQSYIVHPCTRGRMELQQQQKNNFEKQKTSRKCFVLKIKNKDFPLEIKKEINLKPIIFLS